jgi:hypothetical protein
MPEPSDQQPEDIYEALLMLQADPPLLAKSKQGQVGSQLTKYADLPAVNKQVLARLNALGVAWVCSPTLQHADSSGPGRFVLRWELRHVPSGTMLTGDYPLGAGKPQEMGSAQTYARRYALLAVTGVAAEDDDDDGAESTAMGRKPRVASKPRVNAASKPAASDQPAAPKPPLPTVRAVTVGSPAEPIDTKQLNHMHALWGELGYGGDGNRNARLEITAKILKLPALVSSNELTRGQGEQLIAALAARRKAQRAVSSGDEETGAPISRKAGQRSRNAAELIGTGNNYGTEQAPFEDGALPV